MLLITVFYPSLMLPFHPIGEFLLVWCSLVCQHHIKKCNQVGPNNAYSNTIGPRLLKLHQLCLSRASVNSLAVTALTLSVIYSRVEVEGVGLSVCYTPDSLDWNLSSLYKPGPVAAVTAFLDSLYNCVFRFRPGFHSSHKAVIISKQRTAVGRRGGGLDSF